MEPANIKQISPQTPSPTAIVGAILGFGVIRLLSRERVEQRPYDAGSMQAAPNASAPGDVPETN